jgi:Flp pilus assembly protein TadG
MIHRVKPEPNAAPKRETPRGQVLVIFSGTFVVLLLVSALVVDLGWLWSNTLRIQRAADAAALAGVVQLPDHVATGYQLAKDEATKNGYTHGVGSVSVVPLQDGASKRRLTVTVTAPVKTFFLGLIGMGSVTVSRHSKAEFVLPVPMGSPENYYGVFGDVRNATMTTTGTVNHPGTSTATFNGGTWDTSATQPSGTWTNPANADGSNNSSYATASAANAAQQWGQFSVQFTPTFVSIQGIQVRLRALIQGSGTSTDCRLDVALSPDGGTSWTAAAHTTGALTTTKTTYTIGNSADLWGSAWTNANFQPDGSTKFRVRLTWSMPNCAATRTVAVDTLEVNVTYTYSTSGTTTTTATYPLRGPGAACANGRPNCFQATTAGGGQVLNPRGFWATMNTEGAANVNGDAFQPYYDTPTTKVAAGCPTSTLKACYGPDDYYNYAIEMPANSTGGYVYVYDPVFCATSAGSGTGDRWFSGTPSVSSFYELYSDPNNTPYSFADDTLWIPVDNTFRQISASDSTMGGSGGSECRQSSTAYGDGRDYHNSWYLVNPGKPLTGGAAGTIYRLHTTGTEKANPTQQRNTNGEQSFAIYATDAQAPGVYPKVYGLGAMQMFTPLTAAGSATQSEFYLAQLDAVHKTKTLELQLWDPGDTSPLSASLELLIPCTPGTPVTVGTCPAGGWTAATVSYYAAKGTTDTGANSACNTNASASTTSITTSTGASLGLFNGCWATIDAVIPDWYTAAQNGWWKIRYTMNGNGTSNDVTTWTANIRGNPVHLIEP